MDLLCGNQLQKLTRFKLLASLAFVFVLFFGFKTKAFSRTISAASDPDINIRAPQRGWVENTSFPKDIQGHPNLLDPRAPQLSTMFGNSVTPQPNSRWLM